MMEREFEDMQRETTTPFGHRYVALMGALALMVAIACAGCGAGEVRHRVSGTVTYAGLPVEMGSITFDPGDPSLTPDGAEIVDGRYQCEVRPGTMTVRITGSRKCPPVPGDPDTVYEDYIPAPHNTNSTRTVEITGTETIDFDLTSP